MLDLFTTIPGILIICGVVLLVIAIILFVIGARKSKKDGMPSTNSVGSVDMTSHDIKAAGEINDIQNITNEPDLMNYESPQVINIPDMELVNKEKEEVVSNTNPYEFNMPSMEPATDVVNNEPVYGGEMPSYDFSSFEEKPVTIYGGNDPLEATQTMPKMEEHHVPYGGEYQEQKIMPTVEEFSTTPVDEVVSVMPKPVMDTVVSTPEVVDIPEMEDRPVFEMPTMEPTPVVNAEDTNKVEEL